MASLTLDWIQIACVVGALQGLFLTGVIGAQKHNRTANRLLAVLVATFTMYLASTVYFSAGIVQLWPHFFGVAYQTPWVFGPLVFLYAKAASDRAWRFERKTWLHFVPVAINTLATSPYFFMSGAEKLAMMSGGARETFRCSSRYSTRSSTSRASPIPSRRSSTSATTGDRSSTATPTPIA